MAVGNQATVASVNNILTSLSVQLETLSEEVTKQSGFLNKLGTSGLNNLGGAGLGFSLAANPVNNGGVSDAQAVLDDINHMLTIIQLYKGLITQGSTFNFADFLTHLWAGQ
jgi:hypothetical protein